MASVRPVLGVCAMLLALAFSPALAAEYYVSSTGADTNGGSSPADAFRTIQKGVAGIEPARRLAYDHAQLVLDAAMAGQGIALSSDVIAERALRERRLVKPFAITATAPWTYHLVMRPDDAADAAIAAFRAWIVAEVAAWRGRR